MGCYFFIQKYLIYVCVKLNLIEEIATKRTYFPVCKKIAKRDWLSDELHQEFLLRICEIKEKVQEAKDGGYLDWFCMDVISRIWGNRNRVKAYDKGSTNPLYELSVGYEQEIIVEEFEYNEQIDFSYNEIKHQLNKDINSDDKDLNYQARAFAYSNGFDIDKEGVKEGGPCKNARQFANVAKIPYKSVWAATSSYLKKLKLKVND